MKYLPVLNFDNNGLAFGVQQDYAINYNKTFKFINKYVTINIYKLTFVPVLYNYSNITKVFKLNDPKKALFNHCELILNNHINLIKHCNDITIKLFHHIIAIKCHDHKTYIDKIKINKMLNNLELE